MTKINFQTVSIAVQSSASGAEEYEFEISEGDSGTSSPVSSIESGSNDEEAGQRGNIQSPDQSPDIQKPYPGRVVRAAKLNAVAKELSDPLQMFNDLVKEHKLEKDEYLIIFCEDEYIHIDEKGAVSAAKYKEDSEFGSLINAYLIMQALEEQLNSVETEIGGCAYGCLGFLAVLAGGGAAIKQYQGTSKFFDPIAGENWGIALGLLSAIPAAIFYYRSLDRIMVHSLAALIQYCHGTEKTNKETQRLVTVGILKKQFPELAKNSGLAQKLANVLLGIGYGAANLGMVWQSLANDHAILAENKFLYGFFLIATALTNLSVGTDKASHITDKFDMSNSFSLDNLYVELLMNALEQHEELIKELKGNIIEARTQLINGLANCKAAKEMYEFINNKIVERQQALNKKKTNEAETKLKSQKRGEKEPLTNKKIETEDAQKRELIVRLGLKDSSLTSFVINARTILNAGSWVVSGAAIVSNIGGIVSCLTKFGWASTGILDDIFKVTLGILGSAGAWGLNLEDTHSLAEKVALTFEESVNFRLNVEELSAGDGLGAEFWHQFKNGITIENMLGYGLSAVAAASGPYYTHQGIDGQRMIQSLRQNKPELVEGLEQFCSWATFVLMLTTKGHPTAKLFTTVLKPLRRLVQQISLEALGCVGTDIDALGLKDFKEGLEKEVQRGVGTLVEINRELVDYQDKQIEKLIKYVVELAQKINRIAAKMPGSWVIDFKLFTQAINEELSEKNSREELVTTLLGRCENLTKLYHKVMKSDSSESKGLVKDDANFLVKQFPGYRSFLSRSPSGLEKEEEEGHRGQNTGVFPSGLCCGCA